MNIIDPRTVDEIRLDIIRKIAELDEQGMEIFLTLLKEHDPELFRELFQGREKP